jgi:methylenetetrahydrofolate reductase (NADPH)
MSGDHPRHGDHADAKPVFDLDSTALLRVAAAMRDQGRLMSGGELKPPPAWFLGAVENPPGPAKAGPASGGLDSAGLNSASLNSAGLNSAGLDSAGLDSARREAAEATDKAVYRLAGKIEAGAQFVQTQFVFDVAAFAAWLARVRDLGLDERCYILAGVGPVRSHRALAHLATLPGVVIPEAIADRLAAASADRIRAESEKLCSEIIAQLAELPGVAGVHIMAIGAEKAIPAILQQAGLPARRPDLAPPV